MRGKGKMIDSMFEIKPDELLYTVKKAIFNDSLGEDIPLQEKLENAFFQMELMNYALNETMIVAVTNNVGQIIYANDRFAQISGYKKEELIGKTHKIVNSGVHPSSFFQDMWNTILSGKAWTGEICNRRKNGSLYWVKTYILPIVINDQESYFLSIRTDITSEKEKEQLLQSAILSSFGSVVNHLNNLVFQVEKDAFGKLGFSLLTGKIAFEYLAKRGLQPIQPFQKVFKENESTPLQSIDGYLPEDFTNRLFENLAHVCRGEEITYKDWLDEKCIHITLSPLRKNGQIVGAIGFGSDITELESTRKRLAELAYFDHLTGSYNAAALERDVRKKIDIGVPFSFLYMDLDRFKNINDSLGHVTGDQLLQKVTERIRNFIRKKGELYRIGGDEFVVLMDGDQLSDASIQFARLLIQEMEYPFLIDKMEVYISCSIGISYYPVHGASYQSLHRAADLALNVSKDMGKRNVVAYDRKHRDGFINKVQLERDIRAGLENGEFFLMYQPKIDLKTENVFGYEALIRWNKNGKEFVLPNDFIPFAEETGLIIALGRFVLKEACNQAVKWLQKGIRFETISINISPAELEQNDFIQHIQWTLEKTGLPAKYLELEITENVLMKNMERITDILMNLKQLGIKLAMDDFGSGFSNFRYLSDLPIHTLKIDQLFMERILEDRDAVIVSSIIRIGHSLGLEVVAEGVETKEVIDFLKMHNCHIVQGYYYSKPLLARDIPVFEVKASPELSI